jgi:hypothetical protein
MDVRQFWPCAGSVGASDGAKPGGAGVGVCPATPIAPMGPGDGPGDRNVAMAADGMGAALGADDGGGLFSDTAMLGTIVGAIAMLLVDNDGFSDGDGDVARVGARLGLDEIDDGAAKLEVGCADGYNDGATEGMPVGSAVGASEGVPVGDMLGAMVGGIDGATVGRRVVGSSEGTAEGSADGGALGALVDGDGVGENVGMLEGCEVGLRVGSAVGLHARIRRANRHAN